MKHSFTVPPDAAGLRLDVFLNQQLSDYSRSAIQKLINGGMVRLNDNQSHPSRKLHTGDRIEIILPQQIEARAVEPWDFPLEILYEDEHIAAINKPPHLVVHPGAGRSSHTLVHALLALFPQISSVGHPLRPGIVHRLDKETSGVLLIAKTQLAYLNLVQMFQSRNLEKQYRAVAYGAFQLQHGRIEKPLGRDLKNRKKISIRARKTREAVTLYHVLKQHGWCALLSVQILTGRTHQIRVHLSSEGHPIVGDGTYGGGSWEKIPDPVLRMDLKKAKFFGLHAYSLRFDHPIDQHRIYIEAPLPPLWKIFE